MLRVVFMGTPEFAVPALEAVHAKHRIVAVYTQADKPVGRGLEFRPTPVKAKALELGLPVFQPEKLATEEEYGRLCALQADVFVVVAYGKILRRRFLDLPRLGCVNIHSSLLPRWRGAAPIQWAILGGDRDSGVTTMRIVEELDAGNVLLQARTPIADDDTAGTLHDRLARMGAELIGPTLEGLEAGTLQDIPQDPAGVTSATKLTKEMESLDPALDARSLWLRIRALNPWPGTSVTVRDPSSKPLRLKIRRAMPRPDVTGGRGQLFERHGQLFLGASDCALELQSLQWEGKKEVDAPGFLNGLRGRGAVLPFDVIPS